MANGNLARGWPEVSTRVSEPWSSFSCCLSSGRAVAHSKRRVPIKSMLVCSHSASGQLSCNSRAWSQARAIKRQLDVNWASSSENPMLRRVARESTKQKPKKNGAQRWTVIGQCRPTMGRMNVETQVRCHSAALWRPGHGIHGLGLLNTNLSR